MGNIAIIYASVHHGNTKKVVDYLSTKISATVVDVTKEKAFDVSEYDTVIFASGIYFNQFHKSILEYIDIVDIKDKNVVLLYTCGVRYLDYAKKLKKTLEQKGARVLGDCYCRGFDTYGFLAKIGGIAKNHPNEKDLEKIYDSIILKFIRTTDKSIVDE
ncbi:flavodoxin domain-containing protein [Filifactor alocis]